MEPNNKKSYLSNNNILQGLLFLILSIILLIYALINHYGSMKVEWKLSPYLFPVLISVFIGFLSISLISDGIHQIKSENYVQKNAYADWKSVFFTVAAIIIYYIIIRFITFIPATIMFLIAMFLYLGERKIWKILLLSVLTSVIIYVLFDTLLHVMLP